ncbi:MAG: sigma-70 family RNA polymerase sigma factor [Clostridia bacterium]|nr:sigma-70 family RNA polymerase sigma factor [Clostridia bacterium]
MLFAAKSIVGNREDAEDAVQDALIRVASCIGSVETEDTKRLRNYLLIAAKNAAINIKRKRDSAPVTVGLDDASDVGDEDTAKKVAEKTELETIVGCIRSLDPIYSDALYLRFVEKMSEKEIASLLGRKYGTVKMQIKRGRTLLIRRLRERGVISDDGK